MLLTAILVPLSAILAVVAALPTSTDAELDNHAAPGGYEDEGEVIDITSFVPTEDPSVSARSDQVFARELYQRGITCGTGKYGDGEQFRIWFSAKWDQWICMENGQTKTWVDGKNRFKATNRSGAVRCNKYKTFQTNVYQLQYHGISGMCENSRWGRDHVFPGQTFSLYSV